MRRASKVDSNHRVIVAAFRALGCSVQSLAAVGKGVPDLLVGLLGVNRLVEVKTEKGKQTAPQVKWAALWRTPVHLVRNIDDVRRLVSAWKSHSWHHAPASACPVVAPSDVEVDASDYERPPQPGEWLAMPSKDAKVKP